MKQAIMKFLREEKALTTVEYAVAGGVIVAAVGLAFTALSGIVATRITALGTAVTTG